jgi:hypothetical protein
MQKKEYATENESAAIQEKNSSVYNPGMEFESIQKMNPPV